MAADAKRGRGRPPKPAESRKRNNVTLRVRDETKALLERDAAQHQRSLSEEIEARIEQGFTLEKALGGRVVFRMVAAFAHNGQQQADALGLNGDWIGDESCYQAALIAVVRALWKEYPGDRSPDQLERVLKAILDRERRPGIVSGPTEQPNG